MLKVAICDDEEFYIGDVTRLVLDYAASHSDLQFEVSSYTSPFALLDDLDNGRVCDIYLLDIYMDVMDGITLAKSLRKALPSCQIIFLTTSHDHAIAAFEVGAAHYLEKPISSEKFGSAMDRAAAALLTKPVEQLVCRTVSGDMEKLPFPAIVMAESCLREQKLYLSDGRILLVRETLSAISEKLSQSSAFISPHRSFIINLLHAARISANSVTMANGITAPIARGESVRVKREFMEYTFISERRS